MNYDFNIESEDEELWTEALESPEGDSLMKEAVLIQDPISSLGL